MFFAVLKHPISETSQLTASFIMLLLLLSRFSSFLVLLLLESKKYTVGRHLGDVLVQWWLTFLAQSAKTGVHMCVHVGGPKPGRKQLAGAHVRGGQLYFCMCASQLVNVHAHDGTWKKAAGCVHNR